MNPTPTAAFTAIGPTSFRASELTRGPWSPAHQHAGPPIALVCRAVERLASAHGLSHVARLTANLLRPVPIGDLEVETSADYVGRNAGHFSARLIAGDKQIGRFTLLLQREVPMELPAGLPGHPWLPLTPGPQALTATAMPFAGPVLGYADLVETRVASGRMFAEPSAVWFRMRHPLVAGEDTSPYQQVAVAADSGNGISAALDIRHYSFMNSDLSIHLLRRPVGDWVGLDARTLLGDAGGGIAESMLYDQQGPIGRAVQSLMVRPQA
ncbi:MAG TPA: thioesterase family protein [Burkholderiaceae bacterium]|nr:thioesterase family protein [Burkholderiaceae bacterium]